MVYVYSTEKTFLQITKLDLLCVVLAMIQNGRYANFRDSCGIDTIEYADSEEDDDNNSEAGMMTTWRKKQKKQMI